MKVKVRTYKGTILELDSTVPIAQEIRTAVSRKNEIWITKITIYSRI